MSVTSINECDCIIEIMFKKSFAANSFEEKLKIIKNGKPTPDLNIKTQTKTCVRHFSTKIYSTTEWITGCGHSKKLYCWPCLLFSTEKSVWTTTGFSDVNNLLKAIKRHESAGSGKHLSAVIKMKTFGLSRIEASIDQSRSIGIAQHNSKVKNNRNMLKSFIDAVYFLSNQELAFRGNEESASSMNRGNYIELIYFMAERDPLLKAHLDQATVFKGLSNSIQNDIIHSIAAVINNKMREEINAAPFVAILLDESTDIANISQLSVILRYVYKSHVYERFLGFFDVSASRGAGQLAAFVINFLKEHNLTNKLICQSYDGAAVMAGEHSGVQARVREVVPQAIFVHCFAHRLNLILSQVACRIKECKKFFLELTGLVGFFSHSSKRNAEFIKYCSVKLPKIAPTRWKFNGRLVQVVKDNSNELMQFFESIVEDDDVKWDSQTRTLARGFLHLFEDSIFIFLLDLFYSIFPECDVLFDILQTKSNDITFCISHVDAYKEKLTIERNRFDEFWKILLEKNLNFSETANLRSRRPANISFETHYKRIYTEIYDNLINELNSRFESLSKIKFIELLNITKFHEYTKNFPDNLLLNLETNFKDIFNIPDLKTELVVVFRDAKFRDMKNVQQINIFLDNNDLSSSLPQFSKLCQLVLTIPTTTATPERSFSTLKRIKTVYRNRMGQERLTDLTTISVEKELLRQLKVTERFYDDIIDVFSKKERRIELNYKL